VDPVNQARARIAFEAFPFVIMAAVAAVVVLVRQSIDALPLLSLGPAFATVTGELVNMLLTGGVALVLAPVLAIYRHAASSTAGVLALVTIAGVTAAGVIASSGLRRRKREVAELTAIAEVAQQILHHPVPDRVGQVRLAVNYISTTAGARIGGDLYEVVVTSADLRLIIGDVQGRGLQAVQTAATVLGAFREAAYDAPTLSLIADRIEASLARQADPGEQFVTAVLAQVSPNGSRIELLNRGHPPPLFLSRGTARFVEPTEACLPFGLADLARIHAEPTTIAFAHGDRVFFYTDGISEARSRSGDFFSLTRSHALAKVPEPSRALGRLRDEVVRHVGHPLDDDAAMLLLQHGKGVALSSW
jgi:serine phosphatase RsbU (regulator of sigma subunit)